MSHTKLDSSFTPSAPLAGIGITGINQSDTAVNFSGSALYIFQIGNLAIGGELAANFGKNETSGGCLTNPFIAITCESRLGPDYEANLRVGWVLGQFMPYGTVGKSWSPSADYGANVLGIGINQTFDLDGINFGGGVMWKPLPNMTLDLSYKRTRFDENTLAVAGFNIGDVDSDIHRVKFMVYSKVNWFSGGNRLTN